MVARWRNGGNEGRRPTAWRRFALAFAVVAVAALAWAALAGGTQPYETYEQAVAADGPAAQFRLDDAVGSSTLADSAGSYTATNSGIVLGGEGPFGGSKSGSFAEGAHATLPSSPLAGASAFTAEAWVYWNGGTPYERPIFDFGSSASDYMFLTPASSPTGHGMLFEIRTNAGTAFQVKTSELPTKAWEYVAVSETSAGVLTLYLNGAQVAQTSGATIFPSSLGTSPDDYLGRSQSGGPYFNGRMSNIAFYTSALSAGRIQAHYDAAEFPVNTAVPTITGTAVDGGVLTAKAGTWSGLTPITFAYQWQRCNSAGAECAKIETATGSTYQATHEDVGKTLRVAVMATNAAGSGAATSAQTAAVAASKPTNTALPVISGSDEAGELLSVSNGSWEGTPPLTYTYSWETCNSAGSSCKKITGATASSYRTTTSEVGDTLRAIVTATNSAGSKAATSAASPQIVAGAPVNTSPPVLSGVAREGRTFSVSTGSWIGEGVSYSYQWQRCNEAGMSCTNVSGAEGATYVLGSADVGSTVRVRVTATDANGSRTVSSETSAVIVANPTHTAPPSYLTQFTLPSADGGPFHHVGSIALDAKGHLWVLDSGADRVEEFTETGEYVSAFGSEGSGNGQLREPDGIAVDDKGDVWVLDSGNDRAEEFSEHGVYKRVFTLRHASEGIAVDAHGNVWLSDTYVGEIDEFNEKGKYVKSVGTPGAAAGDLSEPEGLAFDAKGDLWIADWSNDRVIELSSTGAYEQELGAPGSGPGQLSLPSAVAVDTSGYVWVTDLGNSRVQEYDEAGDYLSHFGTSGSEAGQFSFGVPVGLTVNAKGEIWVTDPGNQRVEQFTPPSTPVNTSPPTIAGTAKQGETLTAGTGSWSGSEPISYAYAWERCNEHGGECKEIEGATHSTYVLQSADVAMRVRVKVTASNSAGSASADSEATTVVASLPPEPLEAPTITGVAQDEQTLTASTGTWGGTPPSSYEYQWLSCNAAGEECKAISAAEAASYVITHGEVGATLRVKVTAHNSAGSASNTSAATETVVAIAPANTTAPSISGTPEVGETLTASTGTWTGTPPLAYAYQWERCDPEGEECESIGGATAQTYEFQSADSGHELRVTVTATNAAGSASASGYAGGTRLLDTSTPVILGVAQVGQTLSALNGSWQGGLPIAYSYQWQRCNEHGEACAAIAGAHGVTYTLTEADAGSTIRVLVEASNAEGSVAVASAATPRVTQVLEQVSAPSISGSAQPGQTLLANHGGWAGPAPISYAYQWERCEAETEECTAIAGAPHESYVLTPENVDTSLRVLVTATDSAGSLSAQSEISPVVGQVPPANELAPSISGQPNEGQVLLASSGTWSGLALTYSYQWELCNEQGSSCSPTGGIGSELEVRFRDVGHTLRVAVEASNEAGSTTVLSPPTPVVKSFGTLSDVLAPSISGVPQAGTALTANLGTWAGEGSLSYAYQWSSCTASGESCANIPGATSASYTPSAAEVGKTVIVAVTATDKNGSTTVRSAASAPIAAAGDPAVATLPSIAGSAEENTTLTASPGSWASSSEVAYAYQWQLCNELGAACTPLSGATASTYIPTHAQIGSTLRVTVTATNATGSTAATSAPSTPVFSTLANATLPSIERTGIAQPTYTATTGMWDSSGPVSYSYQWRRCNSAGEACTAIAGASAARYTLGSEDLTSETLRVAVTATSGTDSVAAVSSPSASISQPGPLWIAGGETVGAVLTAELGGGASPSGFEYEWQRCNLAGEDCAPISGAGAQRYTVASADVGSSLVVSATPREGGTSDTSSPVWIGAPQQSGSARPIEYTGGVLTPGVVVHAPHGQVVGSEPISSAYQWQRCNSAGGECTAIAGAGGETYEVQSADLGKTLRVIATYANSFGETMVTPPASATVGESAPVSTAPPTLSWQGSLQAGTVVSSTSGSWAGDAPIEYAYQWELCNAEGAGCSAIAGASGSSYTIEETAVGGTLRVTVTASNGLGSRQANAGGDGYLVGEPTGAPVAVVAPTITGTPHEGDELTASHGVWTNAPTGTTYRYQWLRCREERPGLATFPEESFHEGRSCSPISGATEARYRLGEADTNMTIILEVTATNPLEDRGTAYSAETAPIAPGPPVVIAAPRISGEATAGNTLQASGARWIPNGTPNYQWEQCNGSGGECHAIVGATGSGYLLPTSAIGATIRVAATLTDEGGASTETSTATRVVASSTSPFNTGAPTLSGTARDGSTLTLSKGTWGGSPEIAYGYQWQRCNPEGECSAIAGATQTTYTATRADVGSRLEATVTATNAGGSASRTTSESATVLAAGAPTNVVAPSLTSFGVAFFGEPQVLVPGTWTADPEVADHWLRCDPTRINAETGEPRCEPIAHVVGTMYTPTLADIGYELRVEEVATNGAGTVTLDTALTEVVQPGEVDYEGVSYGGLVAQGQTITATSTVSTTPTLPITREYEFVRKSPNGLLTVLQKGTGASYTPTGADVGSEIQIAITTTVHAPGNGEPVFSTTEQVSTPRVEGVLTDRAIPTVSGVFATGAVLVAGNGRWASGSATTTYTYQWERCEPSGRNCAAIPGATGEDLQLADDDIGATVRVVVIANDGTDLGSEASEATPEIKAANAPSNITPPTISGSAQEGATLTANPGEWSAEEPISYEYQWKVCYQPGVPCSAIAGAESAEYSPNAEVVGGTLQVEVTAVAGTAETTSASPATEAVASAPAAVNTASPTVSVIGPATSEAILVAGGGEWAHLDVGTVANGLGYAWERCNASGQDCTTIGGADGKVYDATIADVGSRLRVDVTAVNGSGEVHAFSQPSPVIAGTVGSADNGVAYVEGEQVHLAERSGRDTRPVLSCSELSGLGGEGCVFAHPRISPNGQMVAVEVRPAADAPACAAGTVCPEEDNSPDARIALVNYDGSEARTLPMQGGQPAFSPDGTSLVFVHTTAGMLGSNVSSLETVQLSEPNVSTALTLPENVASAQAPSYSASGGQLAFVGKDSTTGEWNLYVSGAEPSAATEVPFTGIANADEPQILPSEGEGPTEVVFSATDPSEEASASYGGTRPRSVYVGSVEGGTPKRITPAGTDYTAPRLTSGGFTVIATRREPREGGGKLVSHAWEVTRRGTRGETLEITGATEPSEASPAQPTETYSNEVQPQALDEQAPLALAAGGVKSDVACQCGRTLHAPEDNALARQFEPILYVDASDGFLPISETWMLKLGNVGSKGFTRSKVCNSHGCRKVGPESALGPNSGSNERVEYPVGNEAHDEELTTNNTINEWTMQPGFNRKTQKQQEEYDAAHMNVQVSQRHVYYVIAHRHGELTINYWYYYTYNYFSGFGQNCQGRGGCSRLGHDLHQGDWENLEVVLNHPEIGLYATPYRATEYYLSEHGNMHKLKESAVKTFNGHVMVTAAHGDHGIYPMCTEHGHDEFEQAYPTEAGFETEVPIVGGKIRVGLFDHTCTEDSTRVFGGHDEKGEFTVGESGTPENIASSANIERFSCWHGLFGDQDAPEDLGISLTRKIYGTSPRAPLQQMDSQLEEAGKYCPGGSFAT
jgi:sugar lactone lactonase YvrE